jgi:hypothetical protein
MNWTVDDEGRFVVVRTSGQFSPEDHGRMVRDVVNRPFWSPGRDALFDHRALMLEGQAFPAISKAADTHRRFDDEIGTGRAAIVMPSEDMFGVGRMFEEMAGDAVSARLRIFRDEGQAREWLGSCRE